MLTGIHIVNFAIIDALEVDLDDGLTVLTGETGAGKSILIDALGLALGGRAGKDVVAAGARRAEVSATFDVGNNRAAMQWLESHALDGVDDTCLLRRVIAADGPSKAYINDRPVSAQSLRELATELIDIHGQHEHQTLGRPDTQRQLLDHFGKLGAALTAVGDCWGDWKQAANELAELESLAGDKDSKLEFLRYQVDELDRYSDAIASLETLEAERTRLANVHRLADGAQTAFSAVDADDGALQRLARARESLARIVDVDDTARSIDALLTEAEVSLNEAASELARYTGTLQPDPARLDALERSFDELAGLARKHRVEPDALAATRDKLAAERDTLSALEEQIGALRETVERKAAAYDEKAATLTKGRHAAAARMSKQITESMQSLGLNGGSLDIEIETGETERRPTGQDRVRFLVTTNPGQAPGTLGRIASGGELSRISLAIQVIAASIDKTRTVIFDEVDAGVGGRVADIVGLQLRKLAGRCQVLCVTHLPQVASRGEHHLRVNKVSDDNRTRTRIVKLSADERVEEIARMLGGIDITKATRELASDMLGQATRRRA